MFHFESFQQKPFATSGQQSSALTLVSFSAQKKNVKLNTFQTFCVSLQCCSNFKLLLVQVNLLNLPKFQ